MKKKDFLSFLPSLKLRRAGDSHPAKLIFDNLVDTTVKLLVALLRYVQRYTRIATLIGLSLAVASTAGCSVNRVALRTQFKGMPLEIELYDDSGNYGNAGNSCQHSDLTCERF